jgi:hypothetical protein
MKIAEIKKGMKVYPIMKSIEGPLGKSAQWKLAVKSGKGYMTVVKLGEAKGQKPWFECSDKATATTGDKFHAGDLRLGVLPVGKKAAKSGVKQTSKPVTKKTAAKPAAKKVASKPAVKKIVKLVKKPVAIPAPSTASINKQEHKAVAAVTEDLKKRAAGGDKVAASTVKAVDAMAKRREMQKHSSQIYIEPGTGETIN